MTRFHIANAIFFATLTTCATLAAVGSLALAGLATPARAHDMPVVHRSTGTAASAAG